LAQRTPPAKASNERSALWAWGLLVAIAPAAYFAARPSKAQSSPRDIGASFRQRFGALVDSASNAPGQFEDASDALGVVFKHDNAAHGKFRLPEEMGPGVAWFDFDGDDDLDLFATGGGEFAGEGEAQRCVLYRNDGERFVDVSKEVGADLAGPAYGAAAADYDDDGDVDLLVTRLGTTALLRNDGGRFTEVAAASGINDASFGSSAAFFDYDRDGDLDVYVGHYMDWTPEIEGECTAPSGSRDYCDPTRYGVYAESVLYRNLGDGRFENVTAAAGLSNRTDQTLGALAADFDGDGWTDLYVAEDSVCAKLWMNQRNGTFRDAALTGGCAFSARGMAIAGMGVACQDLDDDGQDDLIVTNIRGQSHLVLLNDRGSFHDASTRLGAASWSTTPTGFGIAVFDADLDGAYDGYVANGAVAQSADAIGRASPYAERDQYVSWVDGKLVDRTAVAGFVCEEVGRGVAYADFDRDGDLDLAVGSNGGRLRVLRNRQSGGQWLVVDVRTAKGAPALGARVELRANGRTQRRAIRAHESYLSSRDPSAHFGLAGASAVDEVVVTWPDGARWTSKSIPANQRLKVSRADATSGGDK